MSEERIVGLAAGAFFAIFGLLMAALPMLGRRKLERLKREGVATEAVIVSVEETHIRGMAYNEISLEYPDQTGEPIRLNRMSIGTRMLSEGSTVPVYFDPKKPKSMGLDLDAVTDRPRTDRLRQYLSQAGGVFFIIVGTATMIFVN